MYILSQISPITACLFMLYLLMKVFNEREKEADAFYTSAILSVPFSPYN